MKIHLEKKGIRCLGIAESFQPKNSKTNKSVLSGVVMRSDLLIDGMISSQIQLYGDDATEKIIEMYKKLNRKDINCILIAGSIISLFNIIDIEKINTQLKLPVISLTFNETRSLKAIFDKEVSNLKYKKEQYLQIKNREKIKLKTGYYVFIRTAGVEKKLATIILNKFTYNGKIPEPVKVAKLLARSQLQKII